MLKKLLTLLLTFSFFIIGILHAEAQYSSSSQYGNQSQTNDKSEKVIEDAKKRIEKQNQLVYKLIPGMTKQEVIDAIGQPVSFWPSSSLYATEVMILGGCNRLHDKACSIWRYGEKDIEFSYLTNLFVKVRD